MPPGRWGYISSLLPDRYLQWVTKEVLDVFEGGVSGVGGVP